MYSSNEIIIKREHKKKLTINVDLVSNGQQIEIGMKSHVDL